MSLGGVFGWVLGEVFGSAFPSIYAATYILDASNTSGLAPRVLGVRYLVCKPYLRPREAALVQSGNDPLPLIYNELHG